MSSWDFKASLKFLMKQFSYTLLHFVRFYIIDEYLLLIFVWVSPNDYLNHNLCETNILQLGIIYKIISYFVQ